MTSVVNSYAVVTLTTTQPVGKFDPEIKVFLEPWELPATDGCAFYLENGYAIIDVRMCNYEGFLNAQVDQCVKDYLSEEDMYETLCYQFRMGELNMDEYMSGREVVFESINDHLRTLHSLFSEMRIHDYDVANEVAVVLYNAYF